MKVQSLSFAIALFILIPLAAAKGVVVAGHEVSYLVLLPGAITAFFLVFFGIIMIKDALWDRVKIAAPRIHKHDSLKMHLLSFRFPALWRKSKIQSKDDGQDPVKYLRKLDELELQMSVLDEKQSYDELMHIIRNFFSELLGLEYAFTFDELDKELRGSHRSTVFFSDNFSELCYHKETLTKMELNTLILEMRKVIDHLYPLATAEYEAKKKQYLKKGWFSSLHDHLYESRKARDVIKREKSLERRARLLVEQEEVRKRIAEIEAEEKVLDSSLQEGFATMQQVEAMLRKGMMLKKGQEAKAILLYKDMYKAFQQLPTSEKEQLQDGILRFCRKWFYSKGHMDSSIQQCTGGA